MNEYILNDKISYTTKRNWKKLNISVEERLTKRANKSNSQKRILPLEYFCNLNNIGIVQEILDIMDKFNFSIESVILSLGINQLKKRGIFYKDHVQNVLNEYKNIVIIKVFEDILLPSDETDILGLVYQSFLSEGKKNIIGSYYTPLKIVKNMTDSFDFSKGQIFLDPCCGSGSFLLASKASSPEQLYGIDVDDIAVMISKINLMLKFHDKVFIPQIYNFDFLQGNTLFSDCEIFDRKFDYISTNPPWGSINCSALSGSNSAVNESFSYFFVKAAEFLKETGTIRFLFPESILKVRSHKNIRSYILNNLRIVGITEYNGKFSGVTTKYVDIECLKNSPSESFVYKNEDITQIIPISTVFETENLVFNFLNDMDIFIINKVKNRGVYSLKNSIWALGIVTGDNKNKLSVVKKNNMEKIYTGKEIFPYMLKTAQNYIVYNRKELQQVAKEDIYRAKEKLVYKFISKKLVFAYDDTQSLFLNSANVLIPHIPNMSIKTVMAFLNSELFQFFYSKMFGEVKILKGNLIELPFPDISDSENIYIESIVDNILNGKVSSDFEIQNKIYGLYGFTEAQISYIRRTLNGKVN